MSSLIERIYEAAVQPDCWPSLVTAIGDRFGAKDAAIGAFDGNTGAFESVHTAVDPAFLRSYREHWVTRNFLWQASAPLPTGQLYGFDTFIERDAFERTDIYNEWFHPQGMDRALGANLLLEGSLSVTATLYRPSSKADFDAADRLRFARILPHLQRAWQVRERLRTAEQIRLDFHSALEATDKPALLVDGDATILFANERAERLIATSVLLVLRDRRLGTSHPSDATLLRRTIADALDGQGTGGKIVVRRSPGRPVTLLVSPLHRSANRFSRRSVLILVDDPEQVADRSHAVDLMRRHYGFTRTEARLTEHLVDGLSLRDAADTMGVSITTVRTHLAHVFQKAEVRTQVELIRLMLKAGLG